MYPAPPLAPPRQSAHALIWLLMLLVWIQNLLPIQSHTRLARDTAGTVVVVCTLHGTKTLPLDMRGVTTPQSDDTPEQTVTPACLFSQLMTTAAIAVNAAALRRIALWPTAIPGMHEVRFHASTPAHRQLIRAPPIA